MSEQNEAAARSVLADAAERSMRAMTSSLQPTGGGPGSRYGNNGLDIGDGGGDVAGDGASEELEPLDVEAAAAVKRELLGGEDWASAVIALRRGQEDILEHLLRESR
jgi:hypothetical protein